MARVSTATIPAPIGGWNTRDPLANMKPTDAVIMDNWFPEEGTVSIRRADEEYCTNVSGTVKTLMTWKGPTTQKLFAVAGGSIWDCSTASALEGVTSLSSDLWQWQNITTAGGSYLYAVNGTDSARLYNGTAWTTITGVSTPAITGVTTSDLVHVALHAERLWFVEDDSLSVWYMPVAAVGGAATEINMGSIFREGGKLMAVGSWTMDAGAGMDDYAVFVTSNGEAAVYQGTDPSSSNTWTKVGLYRIGEPIGRRCIVKYAGDLVVICKDGFWSISRALSADRDPSQALSYKIRKSVADAASLYSTNTGWEAVYFPGGPFMLFNVRRTADAHQYVMNSMTGAWCRFTGWDAYCWGIYNEELYYGTGDEIRKAWVDGAADVEGVIVADAMQSYNHYRSPGRVKHFKAARPLLTVTGSVSLLMDINTDYDDTAPEGLLEYTEGPDVGLWDTGLWDTAVWSGEDRAVVDWQTIGGIGSVGALRLKTATSGARASWAATDVLYEIGGIY